MHDRFGGLLPELDVAARPIFVGIGGDSGTGKSTLTSAFYRLFGEERITTVCLDDYHALDRHQRELVGFTALDPRAYEEAAVDGAPPRGHSDPLELTQLILAHRILRAQKPTLVRITADGRGELVGEHQHL